VRALFLNCTLKASPERSNTDALLDVVADARGGDGIDVDVVRVVDLPCDTLVTVHPSAVLRTRPPERDAAFDALVRDLRVAAQHVAR